MSIKPVLVLFVVTSLGCVPGWILRDETERYENAKQQGSYDTLVSMCVEPKVYFKVGAVKSVQKLACEDAKQLTLTRAQERLAKATTQRDLPTLEAMCQAPASLKGYTTEELGVGPVQQQACVEAKRQTAAELERVTKDAAALGGLPCLVKLDGYFLQAKKSRRWLTDVQTDDGQRAALGATADACLGQVEAALQAGKHHELYRQTTTLSLSTTGALSPAQVTRLGAVVKALPPAIAAEYEAQAAALAAEPAAAALSWACAAAFAQRAGDAARQQKDLDEAKAAIAKAGIKEALSVSVTGAGLAAEVVARLKAEGLGAGLTLIDSGGDIPLTLALTAPSFSSDTEKIVLKAEVKEQRGTKIRHEWAEKKKDCEREQRQVDHALDNCRRHGKNNSWCAGLASNQKDVKWCLEKLERIKKEEPAFATVEVPYEGTKYVGTLSGTLSVKQGADAAKDYGVQASDERVGHGFVERAKLSPVNVKPPTAADLRATYIANAASTVYRQLRQVADGRAGTFLDSALKASTPTAMAADVVRFAVIAKKRPEGKVAATLDEKLGLPAMDGLKQLLGSAK